MANPLDWAARAILQINGMSPEEIKQKARQLKAGRGQKPMPKANTKAAKPQVKVNPGPNSSAQGRNLIKEGADRLRKPKPPARPNPGSINPKGQTNAFNAKGQLRDFRNPKVSANRPATTTPVQSRSSAKPTPPNRPPGGFGNRPAGQRSLFGDNPNAKPSGQHKAPSVPKPGTATRPKPTASQQANARWVAENSKAARERLARIGDVTARIRPVSTPGTIAALATSNFGDAGEKPDVRARRLGFKDAADQKAKIAAQQRSTAPKRTPEQAIKDAKAKPRQAPPASTEYKRPKANVSKPSAAREATQKRDYKKLKDFG